jgi:hypothetical protein
MSGKGRGRTHKWRERPPSGRVTPKKKEPAPRPRVTAEIPRPRVTEYNVVTAVPIMSGGPTGPVEGSVGRYDAVFVLGVPGVSSVTTNLDVDALLQGGDSLLQSDGLHLELMTPNGSASNTANVVPNAHHRLARIETSVTADNFKAAETEAHNQVIPVLSRLAFEADTPVEVVAMVVTEVATQIRSVGAHLLGLEQPAPDLKGMMTPEIRPYLAAYREGLNSNSPMYQALSFYKVVEGVSTFAKRRGRRGGPRTDPLEKVVPFDLAEFSDLTEWAQAAFKPYLGKTFAEIKSSVETQIRNAVAHLVPDRDVRVADYLDDLYVCRDVIPILRFMARSLIADELVAYEMNREPEDDGA